MIRKIVLLYLWVIGIQLNIQAQNPVSLYDGLFNQFLKFGNDWDKQVASIHDYKIEKDAVSFHLKEGQIYLLPLINARPALLVFKGTGTFGFTPATQVEKENLHRFFGVDTIETEFENLFLIIADSTFEKILSQTDFSFVSGIDLEQEFYQCMQYICDTEKRYLPPQILKTFLDNNRNGLFYANIWDTEYGPLFYMIDPYDEEEVKFLRSAIAPHYLDYHELISQFGQTSHFEGNIDWDTAQKDFISVSHYKIEGWIEDNLDLDFSAVAELTIHALIENPGWIYLDLYSPFEVDSVQSQDGESMVFKKGEENPFLWIYLKPPFSRGNTQNIKIYYRGDFLKIDSLGRVLPGTTTDWYPNYGNLNTAYYDLTFHSPAKFPHLVSVGSRETYIVTDRNITSHWVTKSPVYHATLNLGDYKIARFEDLPEQPVKILGNRGSDLTEDVGADLINSYALFTRKFGSCSIDTLYAVETPFGHGEAFPGVLHLSSETFNYDRGYGYHEVFRAHEVAHQWWGLSVRPASYHDYWLAEGLCTFCGLMYLQTIYYDDDGTDKYFELLHDYRENILQNRQYLIGSGQEAGPIWLGYRTKSSTTSEDYNLIVYQKSAWVFHMLRVMMINERNFRDEALFYNILYDYHKTFRGKKASSEDFIKIVEKHTGMKMDWFFDQWIKTTGIPEYEFDYQVEESGEDKYLITCKITQSNVPSDFKMPVLFKIDFDDNGASVLRRMVSGAETEIKFLSPMEPEDVIFNYLESVLCTVN